MRAERGDPDDLGGYHSGEPRDPRPRSGAPRNRSAGGDRPARRGPSEGRLDAQRPRSGNPREQRAPSRSTRPSGGIRGSLGVLGIFLVTLAAAGADSFVGVGLGTLTLIALVAGTVVAALVVRRGDLATVVVAAPLVFVGVALVNIALAPSATLNLATLATLLIRGFPAMAIAVAAALVLTVVRLVARR